MPTRPCLYGQKDFGQPLGSSLLKWAKRHWSIKARGHFWMDHLQAKALQHLKLPKPTLVTIASNRFFWLFGIPNWGDGSIPGYWIPLVEKDDGLAKSIHGSNTSYVKGIKDAGDFHPPNIPIKSSTDKSFSYITCHEPKLKFEYLIWIWFIEWYIFKIHILHCPPHTQSLMLLDLHKEKKS